MGTRKEWIAKLRSCANEYQKGKTTKIVNRSPSKLKLPSINNTKAPIRPQYDLLPDGQSRAIAKTIYSLESRSYLRKQRQISNRIRGKNNLL